MATPDKPSLDYSYTAFQESQGDNSFPGTQLDNDLANLKLAIDETIDFASLAIRSDGKLNNGIVTKNSLAADVLTGVAAPTVWATATDYLVDETVTTNNGLYLCLVAHTSDVFADDIAAGKWANLAIWSPLTEVADGTISTAKLVDGAVTGPKLANGAVGTSKLADASVTRAKVAANFGLMPIGATLDWDGPLAPAGWAFKFGQALSRATYIDLLAALTATVIGNAAISNNTLTGISVDLRNLGLEGAPIEGPGVQTGTTVASVTINTIVLSQNASANATSGQYRVFPHGNGDGSTTFNLPDDRDRASIGRGDATGGGPAHVAAAGNGNPGLDTTKLGAAGGVDRHALADVQVPQLTGTAASAGAHVHGGAVTAIGTTTGSNASPQIANGALNGITVGNVTSGGDHTHAVTVNSGGGQAHPNVQPSRSTNKIIFTGVV